MNEEENEVKSQSVELLASFVFWNGLKGIIGYIASYFFRPWWDKIVNWHDKSSNNEHK